MFGKLRPTGLKGCSAHSYQASFCGSCHSMAEVNRLASLTTSYDLAFLHHVIATLENAPTRSLPCTALPYRNVAVRELRPESRRWLSALNILLLAAKCEDDILDEGSWKGRFGMSVLSRRLPWARQVMEETGFPVHAVSGLPQRQAEVESLESPTLEALAMPTSLMLGEVFGHVAFLCDRPESKVPLRHLGQGLGMAIYIQDASDDLERDRRRKRFNAIDQSQLGPHQLRYTTTSLQREIRRATIALEGLGLSGPGQPLPQILQAITRPPEKAARWTPFTRRRKAIAGDCACDCGGCGGCEGCCDGCCGDGCWTSECDCNGCSRFCDSCNCGHCGCEGCGGPGQSQQTAIAGSEKLQHKPSLLCPACGERMHPSSYFGIEIDECYACHGLWFDHQELEQISKLKNIPPRLLMTREPVVPPQLRPEGTRPCPRCAKNLTTTPVKGVHIDICSDCKGVFLDQGELNTLLDSAT